MGEDLKSSGDLSTDDPQAYDIQSSGRQRTRLLIAVRARPAREGERPATRGVSSSRHGSSASFQTDEQASRVEIVDLDLHSHLGASRANHT